MIFLSGLNIFVLLLLLWLERNLAGKNIFSPGSLFIYFAMLPALSNLYFSIFRDNFNNVVLDLVAPEYRDINYVYIAIAMNIVANITTYLGILYGVRSKIKYFKFVLDKILYARYLSFNDKLRTKNEKLLLKFGIITFILGLIVYGIFLRKIGGLFQLWQELSERSTKNAGLGYYQTFYMIAIQLGAMVLLWYALKNKKKLLQILITILTIFILGSMGARGPVIIFLLSILIMYHYLIKRVPKIFTIKFVTLLLFLPIFIVLMLQFRNNSSKFLLNNTNLLIKNSINSFESGFIARVGRLERDIVILKYFDENNFWWGKSFYGLIYAPIPRSILPDKPPNDSGMYLRVMALGQRVDPPMPVKQLGTSSWPEANWVGYMNWGFPGFIFFFFLSGLLFGKFYKYVKHHGFPVIPTCLFTIISIGGPPILSPPGIINLIMLFLVVNILIILGYLPFKMKLNIHPQKYNR